MNRVTLLPGDNRISLAGLADNSVDSCVCDPPYGLVSIQKRFGKQGAAPARREKNDGSFARLSGGFMGKAWDSTGIENDPKFWAEVLRVLKPGAYIVAFSSSRTYHRMATAIEDAGFITHPMIGWCYGQGFPKAHAADKAIDKHLGKKGKYDGVKPGHEGFKGRGSASVQSLKGTMGGDGGFARPWMEDESAVDRYHSAYTPATEEAAAWQGWAYGGQVRKPALEPIYVGQKPFSTKSGAENLLQWGVGAVNIDGCRVPSEGGQHREGEASQDRRYTDQGATNFAAKPGPRGGDPAGRHPANLIHDGSAEVVALFPASAGQQGAVRGDEPYGVTKDIYGKFNGRVAAPVRGDTGSAARFFESYPFDGEPLFYQPKAGKGDRAPQFLAPDQQGHPTVKPIALMQSLVRHVTPLGGTTLDPFAGSGTTGEAALREGCNCILMEAEPEYIGFLERRFGLNGGTNEALNLYREMLGM